MRCRGDGWLERSCYRIVKSDPCSLSIHWHDHGVWCVRTSCTCSQSTDGHHRRLRCMMPPSAASTITGSMFNWVDRLQKPCGPTARCRVSAQDVFCGAGYVCFDGLVRHDILQERVYWYWVKGFLNGGKDVDRVLEQVAH